MSYLSPTTAHYPPVSPTDIVSGPRRSRNVGFQSIDLNEKEIQVTTRTLRADSDSSTSSDSLATPRKTRFAEATSVYSPAKGPGEHRSPFADPPSVMAATEHKPSDVGFGYLADNGPVEQHATIPVAYGAGGQPLKSAMKTPGTTTRLVNPMSPTFREEQMLEREEEHTEKQQAKDIKIKTRVRMAKMALRGVSFSCSLIVLSMVSTTFMIFNATKHLPARNGKPAWSPKSHPWPQIVVLSIAAVSLFFSVVVMAAYCRGGHRRAEKVAVYYTMFAMGYFVFSIVMWLIGAAVLQGSKSNGDGQDIWGWSCKDNQRRQLFQDDVHYALVCRLQDWSLVCCIIEIVVEIIVIAIYGVVFYRFYSKNRLRKTMDARDKARSDLYLAQLRSQSAPNTPGFAHTPRTPRFPTAMTEISKEDPHSAAENGYSQKSLDVSPQSATTSTPFKLQAPPSRTPKTPSASFGESPALTTPSPPLPSSSPELTERRNDHVAAAPGEQVYESVPIPGAYAHSTNHQGPGQAY
ncbi:hypothetical protein LTR70_000692 [Exophiala xenobiotica]|uniref:Uncharacterized protein n=1 Tax=Lithohypha guttulata TaxID=1690604 RepID=A0ABR0KNF6_9EURO|nr:hypothetical protein LTR24_000637 [Lithohypha guttulata]KAK5329195.1 hypothetical protein LTR70_000692 [Exophiala xenobiotica]